jgi:predicted transcriptional regulator
VDFATACNRAAEASITIDEIAQEIGVTPRTLRRARLHPTSRDYTPPPEGWEAAIATLARYRAADLVGLAVELEGRSTGRGFWRR